MLYNPLIYQSSEGKGHFSYNENIFFMKVDVRSVSIIKVTSESEEPKKKKTRTQRETPQIKDAGEKKEEVQDKSKDKPDEVGEREKARERAEREKCKEAEKRESERRIRKYI